MKKAQHEQVLLYEKGELIGWSSKTAQNLIESANSAVITEETKRRTNLSFKELADIIVYEWFEQFVENGITKEIIKELDKRMSWIEYRRSLMHNGDGHPYWREVCDAKSLHHPDLRVAYIISHLLVMGGLDGLKRCELKDCRKFFLGPPNRQWCSKKCGSLHRVRKQRKQKKSDGLFDSI